jgi:excisionase family DNA binding protein
MRHNIKFLDSKQPTTNSLLSPAVFHARLEGAVGKSSIYEAVKGNRIKHLKLGRKILILASEVEAWPLREAERVAA